ncbi:cutinase family protein [Mycolicibacter acidiphilus]|uniref:cutinase family protein n=1 Tax=Mycolicibacter acidiphilus TaxID=2835306 RepID=UPI0027DCD360|nr:cutinase family protein [Mycolicibacter acidiphilus]
MSAPTAPVASAAQPCPDVEVIFARGSDEPPGVGKIGQAFVDALRPELGGRSLQVYPVDYAAVGGFSSGAEFARSVVGGIRDEAGHIQQVVADCPDTRLVLGGYSQGAAVTGYVTSPAVPTGVPDELLPDLPEPMPAAVAEHVAAVVLFGTPSPVFIRRYSAPPVIVGPLYAGKAIELCAVDDSVCNGAPDGIPFGHFNYPTNGMAGAAADFTVGRLDADTTPQVTLHGSHGR